MKEILSLCIGVSLLLAGCASYTQNTQKMRESYQAGDFEQALGSAETALASSKNMKLLYLLEKGVILDRLGRRQESRQHFFEADRLAEELYTTSISKEALTYIYNETAQAYPGEDYEILGMHAFLALSFLEDNDMKAVRVQANKINNLIAAINNRYEKNKNRIDDDAFARYLAGTIYESLGQTDDAIIDYRKALALYEGPYQKHLNTPASEQLVKALYRQLKVRKRDTSFLEKNYPDYVKSAGQSVSNSFQVVVFHEVGINAVKVAQEFIIPLGQQIHRVSFPVIHLSENYPVPRVLVGETIRQNAELIQPMDRISKVLLEDRHARYMIKAAARLILKAQAQAQVQQNFGDLAGLAATIYNVATETADTRSWTTMPGRIFATRIELPAGEHSLSIRTGSQVLQKIITAKAGQIVMLRHKG